MKKLTILLAGLLALCISGRAEKPDLMIITYEDIPPQAVDISDVENLTFGKTAPQTRILGTWRANYNTGAVVSGITYISGFSGISFVFQEDDTMYYITHVSTSSKGKIYVSSDRSRENYTYTISDTELDINGHKMGYEIKGNRLILIQQNEPYFPQFEVYDVDCTPPQKMEMFKVEDTEDDAAD